MQWVLLGVVVLALLLLSSSHPKTAFGMLGALVLAAAVIVFDTRDDGLLARHKIPVTDVRIENAVITPGYGDSYQFNARLANTHATVLLKEAVISITMHDCPAQGGECTTIGQVRTRINLKIPPGQARDVSRNIFFNAAKPVGEVRWEYRVTETRS